MKLKKNEAYKKLLKREKMERLFQKQSLGNLSKSELFQVDSFHLIFGTIHLIQLYLDESI